MPFKLTINNSIVNIIVIILFIQLNRNCRKVNVTKSHQLKTGIKNDKKFNLNLKSKVDEERKTIVIINNLLLILCLGIIDLFGFN